MTEPDGRPVAPVAVTVRISIARTPQTAARIDRNIWVEQDFIEPSYAGRPWVMWTASSRLRLNAAATPLHWVVVQQ